jgi:ribonuclease HI
MEKTLIVHTDGGARGNPGPAAIGVLVQDEEGKEMVKFGKTIGRTTNNVAEYCAVIAALEWVKNNLGGEVIGIKFFLDSSLVVNQLNGLFKVKENHLRELVLRVRELEQAVGGNISYHYISRSENKIADSFVNASLGDLNQ